MTVTLPPNPLTHSSASSYIMSCPKIYVAICYNRHPEHRNFAQDPETTFSRAGRTFLENCRSNFYAGYDLHVNYRAHDVSINRAFSTKRQFFEVWAEIGSLIGRSACKVAAVGMFLHHTDSGKIAAWSPQNGGETISAADVSNLELDLPWEENGFMFQAGCNSDTLGSDGINVARAFHAKFNVRVYYSVAFSYFSKDYMSYKRIATADTAVYLLAFKRRKNLSDSDSYIWNRLPFVSDKGEWRIGLGRRIKEGVIG